MDVKDLRSEAVLNERSNDGSKYVPNATVPSNRNKLYQDMGPSPVGKVDVPSSRPCAVIGPDRVVPPSATNDSIKKGAYEAWCTDNVYRPPPEYPHKISSYQTPIRNISPRQTFQENMQRIMVPPTYNSIKGSEDPNFQEKNAPHSKNIKSNIPLETKYCEVPYNLINNDQKSSRNTELCAPSVNPVLTRTAPHGWPPQVRPQRTLPGSFGAPEFYQYPEFTNCAGPRPVPMNRPHRIMHEESGHVYPDHYSQDGNIRFKPYPTSKDPYPQTRYEYIGNYPNPYQPSPPFPTQKYDLQKPNPLPYAYPPVQLKYLDSRIVDPSMDGYQRPNPQSNYSLPFRNQMIHPAYGPVLGNCVQNKYPGPPDSSVKPIAPNKLPYETNKMYVDYDNIQTKTYPSENFYYNEIPRTHHTKSQIMSSYAPVNVHGVPPYPYYRKENLSLKNYEFMPHYRNMDPSFMPMSRIASQFSPSSIAISPSDSSINNDATQIQNNSQEDYGYVSQSPTASIRSFESSINRADFYKRYESRYGHALRMSMISKPEQNSDNFNAKDKKGIDVRQFLQMWNEVDDENCENATKDVPQLLANDVNKAQKKQYEIHKNQDQLYVLGLVNVPNEELSKYEHIQKVSKLPENIKGYNNIELLKQFEEVIESSNVNNFNAKLSNSRDIGYRSIKGSITHQAPDLLQRPISPLDVESKISQSVIHKEVGCNFEIKPCSPKMLNVEVAAPIQTVLGERVIEKVTNPLNMAPPILRAGDKMNCNIINQKDHRKSSSKNLDVSSCKMINTPFSANNLVRSNYSLQDLESNSGVCLASLPRLDNDIELNFPEVNQQFINANKGDSVITKTPDLPTLTLEQPENAIINDKEKSSNLRSEISCEFSSTIIESEREVSKLSKYRKKKIDLETSEIDISCASSQNLRTDSVIIKNPENSKIIESNKVLSPVNKLSECTQQISSNLSIENSCNIKTMESNMEVDLPMDIAIDFSLKNENSHFTTGSPLNKLMYGDTNQNSNIPKGAKSCNIDNTRDSTQSQANSIIEELKNSDTNLLHNQEGDDRSIVLVKKNIKANHTELSKTMREPCGLTGLSLTELNDQISIKEQRHDKNVDRLSNYLNNSSSNPMNKPQENEHSFEDESPEIINDSVKCMKPSPIINNKIECPDDSTPQKNGSKHFLNETSLCTDAATVLHSNAIASPNASDESDDSTQESDSDSESNTSSTSTTVQDDTESEDETVLHSPPQKQDSTTYDKRVAENYAIYDANVNISLERRKIATKLYKELLSPRIQNLLTYSVGFVNISLKKYSENNHSHHHVAIIEDDDKTNDDTESAIPSHLNNCEESNCSIISDEYDTNIETESIHNDGKEKNTQKYIGASRETVEDLKLPEILHGEKEGTKAKNIKHNDNDSCNKNSEEKSNDDSCNKSNNKKENHPESLNDMKRDTQFVKNINDPDNCIESFCDKNIDNLVKSKEIAHDDIKVDTQKHLNLKYMDSVFDESTDKEPNDADISCSYVSENIKDNSYSNQINGNDDNGCDKNTKDEQKSTEISHDNINQNPHDAKMKKVIEKSSENIRDVSPTRLNCSNISCDDIHQDSQCDKNSNHITSESVEMIQSSKKNNNCEKFDTHDTKHSKCKLECFCNRSVETEMLPNNNDKEHNNSICIETYMKYICNDEQKSLKILHNEVIRDAHNLKDIEDTKSYTGSSCDKYVAVELKSADMQYNDQKENPGKKSTSEEELKSAKMQHYDQSENTEEHVSKGELKPAEMQQYDQNEKTEKEATSEEDLNSEQMQSDGQNENAEELASKDELKSAPMQSDDQNENAEEPTSKEKLISTKMQSDDRNENATEEHTSEEELNTMKMQSDDQNENTDEELISEENHKQIVEEFSDQSNELVGNKDISEVFTNSTIITYKECLKHGDKDTEILSVTNNLQPFTCNESNRDGSIKKRSQLKRSLSESALDSFNNDSSDNLSLKWQAKRRRNNVQNFIPSHLFESNFCTMQNNRRNSVSATYTDENVSFCILIDDNCIITEEDENSEEQEKICFAEISEDYLPDAESSANGNENTESPAEILLCAQEENNQYSECETIELVEEKSFEQEDKDRYSESESPKFEESWVEDIACVETVVSEDIADDVIISAHSSPKQLYSPEYEDTEVLLNSEHADKVKYIYGDKMCNDDAQFLETLYRTPQMDVNKTLIRRESQMSDEFNQFYNKESLEQILSESNNFKDTHNELNVIPSDTSSCASGVKSPPQEQLINTKGDEEKFDTINDSPIGIKALFSNDETNVQQQEYNKLIKTQDDTVHSCESSTDNVFTYTQKDDYTKNTISSSPEVSSTTSEDKNASILLKIADYNVSRMSDNNVEHESKRISCKFTEANDYSTSLFNVKTPNRPLITKAAQKYIPPLKETIRDLKIRLPLPEHSLLKLKQLKLLKGEPKHNKYSQFSKKELPKKVKPKFEDVLKSIDEIQFQRHKGNNKKIKKTIPKVVIKKNENGSHYASTTRKVMYNPDLTGRKWQPWVFLEKNDFIDKMALRNKKNAVYSHRKDSYVIAEKFRKYKSISSTKFIISQQKLDDPSVGPLKYTIRLKHT